MTANEWQTVWFTAWVSALSTLLILPFGLATAWLLARQDWPGKSICETRVALPLVMPPVATGLLLLKLLGRRGPIGGFLHDTLGLDVVFTWRAVLIALGVMSFPLLVRSARVAFEEDGEGPNSSRDRMLLRPRRAHSGCASPVSGPLRPGGRL